MSDEYVHFNNNTQPAVNEDNLNLMQQLIKQDIAGAVSGDTLPIGAIMPFGGGTVPDNYLLCNGQAVSRTTYAQLFSIIGTTYGVGDGSTTFNVPDMRGRTIVGYDSTQTEFNSLGKTGGEKNHTLTISEIPSHSHAITTCFNANGFGSANSLARPTGGTIEWKDNETFIKKAGGGQAHNNLQPYNTTNYIIKAFQTAGVVAEVVNEHSESATNVYSCNYINSNFIKVFPVPFSTGAIEANADLYDKTKSITTSEISSDYTPIGIVGQTLVGAYYSHCPFTRLYVGGTNNRTLYWSIKNTFNAAITTLSATVYVLAIKTSI